MKAIVQERFGSPDVLQLRETDRPGIGPDDVLVRVHAAALNPYDWHILRGDPYVARLMGEVGLTRPTPQHRIAGVDGAGIIEAVGADYFVWASDYPHIDASFGVVGEIRSRITSLSEADQAKVLGLNAQRFYGLEVPATV